MSKIFSVSLIAFSAAICGAHAEIASVGYVTQIVNGLEIPQVNNGTLTIQQNGVDVATFDANAADAATANIVVPTKVSDLENDSNFVNTTELDTRELISNKVKSAGIETAIESEDKYPSMKTAQTIANVAAGAVRMTTDKIADDAVTTAKIAPNAVTSDKLAADLATRVAGAAQTVTGGDAAAGKVVTSVTKSGDTITATMDYVKIPVGDASGSGGAATIWVE